MVFLQPRIQTHNSKGIYTCIRYLDNGIAEPPPPTRRKPVEGFNVATVSLDRLLQQYIACTHAYGGTNFIDACTNLILKAQQRRMDYNFTCRAEPILITRLRIIGIGNNARIIGLFRAGLSLHGNDLVTISKGSMSHNTIIMPKHG